ncbi:ribonuclease H-like domain-containing protein [Tanacetum coccineum]
MDKCTTGLGYNAVPPPYTGNFMPPKHDLVYPSLDDFVDVNESVSESVIEKHTVETNEPKTARKENGALIIEDWVSDSDEENVPKVKTVEMFHKPRPMKNVINNAYSTARRPFNKITAANNSNFTKKVNIVKGTRVNTARPKAVISVVEGNKGNAVKASACWVWRPKYKVLDHVSRNNGASMSFKRCDYIDAQGRSKHMTGNKSYLTDYEEIDGGFVAFGGNSKRGKITGKDFKLTDKSHVLLKVPRKDNMYSVDLKNVVPQGGLTCLFAKATPDESNLWHRRLGHVNFKTMNKLVRGNLVRGIEENLIDLRVKVIRCDNGTEFKNRVMNQFIEMKGIKREFSVARTLQQNGVAERKNKTLIEAARTMLADLKLPTTFWAYGDSTWQKIYILITMVDDDPLFSQNSRVLLDAGFKTIVLEKMKKVTKEKERRCSTVNVAGTKVNAVDPKTHGLPNDLNMPDLALYDNESWNDPRDFTKPVKAISLPQDVPHTSDCHFIELENQVQRLMEARLAPKSSVQVKKITSSCEICSGPHDT